jgi:hypothetical protein
MKKKRRGEWHGQHVRIHLWELKTAAYRSLSLGARALLVELRALHNGHNNGNLFLSVREAAKRLGCSKNFAGRLLAELQDRGFIRLNAPGCFDFKTGARRGMGATWVLTDCGTNWCGGRKGEGRYLVPPTKNFMHWVPADSDSTVPQGGTDGPPRRDTNTSGEGKVSLRKGHFGGQSAPNGPSGEDTGMYTKGGWE